MNDSGHYSDSCTIAMRNAVHQNDSNFVISLLNIRSLSKHHLDLGCDTTLTDSDLISLTETHLFPAQEVAHFSPQCFFGKFQNHCTPFNSLAVLHRNSLKIKSFIYFDSINGALLRIKKAHLIINILILYRNNNSTIELFLVNLQQIMAAHNIHIVLGDFNITFLDFSHSSTSRLLDLMESFNFKHTVSDATFVPAGTLLDHVYINMAYVSLHQVTTVVKSVYYSDHDAVKLCVPLDSLFNIDRCQS